MRDFEKKLVQLKKKRDELINRRVLDNFSEISLLEDEILTVERELCELKGIEYALPYDFGISICENPIILSSYRKALLINSINTEKTAIITFIGIEELKFGGINDEVIESHDLAGHGLDIYGTYIIKNSRWKSTLLKKNSVHSDFSREYWNELQHFLIRTKDGEFSCIASSFTLDIYDYCIDQLFLPLIKL